MCKKKILTLILTLTVAISATVNYKDVFATDSVNDEIVVLNGTYSDIIEVGKFENIGSLLCIKGTILNVLDKTIVIEDNGLQVSILIENFEIDGLSVGDSIFAKGIVTKLSDSEEQVLLIQNVDDIGLLVSDDDVDTDDNSSQDDNTNQGDDSSQDGNPNQDGNTNQNGNINQGNNSNQGGNNIQNGNSNQGGNSGNINNNTHTGSVNSNSNLNINTNLNNSMNSNSLSSNSNISVTTASISKIKSKTIVTISDELSDTQWEKVNAALEEGLIKIKDLPNNKIKIVQILDDSGDKVWIVNDPEKTDEEETEEDSIFTVGYDLVNNLNFTGFDVTESKWTSILEDIRNGEAKAKLNSDGDLNVIYVVDDGSDTITTISKIDS